MALTDLTRISTSGIATGTSLSGAILHGDAHFRGTNAGINSAIFDSSDNALEFNDNVKIKLGNSGDLELYHSGSGSYITDSGAGSLYVQGTNLYLADEDGTQMLYAANNAGVNLYYAGGIRFNTTSTGAVVTGILTATSFSGPLSNASGISTFYDLRVSNNLTVEGTTTTLDTNLIGVDRIEVGANSNSIVGVAITQSGTADILNLYDGSTEVFSVADGGNTTMTGSLTISSTTDQMLNLNSSDNNGTSLAFQRNGSRQGYIGYGGASSGLIIANEYINGAVAIQGNDGGNYINMLSFDTANEGVATLHGGALISAGKRVGFATDSNTYFEQDGLDRLSFTIGGLKTVSMIEAGTSYPVLLVDKNGTNTYGTQGAGYNSNANSNDLVIGNVSSGNHGMTICTPSTGLGNINFSDGSGGGADAYRGSVGYNHSTEQMIVRAKSGAVILKNDATNTLVASGGKVGIGTDNPTAHLQVYRKTSFASNPIIQARSNNGSTNELKFEIDGDGDAYFNGKVGLGTITPRTILHLHDSASTRIQITDDAMGAGTGDGVILGLNGDDDFFINNRESGKGIKFFTGSDDLRFHIASDGQVNVNASSESLGGKVLIKNNVNYNTTDFDDDPTLYLLNGDQTTGVSEAAIVLAGRNTAGSTYRAAISGNGSTGLKFYTTSNTELDDTPAMIINGSGNIGINETAPSEKLQIDGDILLGGQANSSESNYAVKFEYNNHQFAKIVGDGRDSSGYGDIDFYTSSGSGVSNLTQRMSIRADGKIGIVDATNNGTISAALHVINSSPEIRITNTTQPNSADCGKLRITEYANSYMGGYMHYDGSTNVLHFGVHENHDSNTSNDENAISIDRDTGQVHIRYGGNTKLKTTNSGVDFDSGTSTLVNIRGDSAGTAGLRLGGDSSQNQCTGFVEVHQDDTHGGGMFYNGDASPAFANSGEAADYFSLFRASSGQRHVVQRWFHSSNDCEFLGDVLIDKGTSSTLRVRADNGGQAGVMCGGDNASGQSQSTGYFEVHQDDNYGGGFSYNGDGTPAFVTGETADHITFYRKDSGTRTEVFSYPYNSSKVTFNDEIVWSASHANYNSYNFMGGLFQAGTSAQNATNAPLLATTRHYGYGYQETFSTSNGAWTNPYPNLVLGYHTGVMIGGHPNYNGTRFFNDHPSATTSVVMNVGNGNNGVGVPHSLSKGGGTFRIRHPHPSKKYTHDLQHSFIEGPQCDNIYRGRVDLVDGSASINIDIVSNMTDGTFILLNRDIQCFTSNETGWTAVKGSVSGNILTITAQDISSTDTISWMVIGERQDDKIKSPDMDITDADGKLIVEPLTIESSHM